MANAASIILNDGQATPVGRTFKPISVTPAETILVCDEYGHTAVGQYRLTASMSRPSVNRDTYRVKFNLAMPIEYLDADGNARLLHTGRSFHEFVIPADFSEENRSDMSAFAKNAFNSAALRNYVEVFEAMW